MKNLKIIFTYCFILGFLQLSYTHVPPKKGNTTTSKPQQQASYRSGCSDATAQTDLAINNVRARLKTAGDFWWDTNAGKYIVPNVAPGETAVSSIFAGGLWMGGLDEGGNLKTACQTYGSASGNEEFWPGPLTDYGEIGPDSCANWDRFFTVHKTSVDQFKANWAKALSEGRTQLALNEIPEEIKGWPALGNPFFENIHGFALPTMNQRYNGLAGFWDVGGLSGVYEPQFGDFPIVDYRGFCHQPIIPDQMTFSIINDAGGIHTNSGGDNILMEIQSTAFAFKAADEVNDMTFYSHRMINRAIENIDSTYIGIWMDPDLGCLSDDYVGCDIDRNLAYVYNADDLDGNADCEDCGVSTYCTDIPVLGIDIFRGPINELGYELEMSSFTYYGSPAFTPNNAMVDPETAPEFYNYLTGSWKDGTPFTYGGNGYSATSQDFVKYAFPSPPNDDSAWSMCSEGLAAGDFRTVQAVGPFTLLPGAINELILGVIWVPSIEYPCPDLSRFFDADDKAQELFGNCFDVVSTNLSEPVVFDAVNIFPNPYSLSSGGLLNIVALPTASTVSIFDITGRLLKMYAGENQMQLDLQNDLGQVSPGTYVIQIKTEEFGDKAYKLLVLE